VRNGYGLTSLKPCFGDREEAAEAEERESRRFGNGQECDVIEITQIGGASGCPSPGEENLQGNHSITIPHIGKLILLGSSV